MADKLIQITVKATTRDAEANLPKVTKALKDLEQQAKQASVSVESSAASTSQSFWRIENVAKLALGVISSYYVKMALDSLNALADQAAANMEVADSFERLADRYGLDSDRIVEAMKQASKGTVAEADLILLANKAIRLGVADTVDELESLMKIAYVRSKELGISVDDYWNRMTRAMASGYPESLRLLGLVIDNEQAYKAYGASIGVAADELTEQEQIQARVNAVLADGTDALGDWADMELTVADNIRIANAEVDDAKQKIGELAAVVKGELAVALVQAAESGGQAYLIYRGIVEGTYAASRATEDYRGWLGRTAVATGENIKMQQAYNQAFRDATGITAIQIEHNKELSAATNDMDMKLRDARRVTDDLGQSQEDLAEDTDDASKAADRSADAFRNYLVAVERRNAQFTSRMEEMFFRQTQAAENAAFRLSEIERDAGQSRDDLLAKQWLDELDKLEKHQMKMRWSRQDYLDDLKDMEYDYQQEKKELLDQAPWWVRNALGKEFAERERIARTGDKKALAEYDKQLLEKIRLADPAYAKQLQKLQQQYNHEKAIEQREFKQGNQRAEEQYAQESRAQERQLNQQLSVLERELVDQRQAWEFHDRQRLENETRAMEELRRDHAYQLETMREDVEYRLGTLPDLWKHAGYAAWVAWLQGFNDAQGDYGFTPATGYDPNTFVNPFAPSAQFGMDYVPRTMQMTVHQGEAILPAREAERYRAGPITIGALHLHGNYTPFLAQKMARELADQLGPMMNQRSR